MAYHPLLYNSMTNRQAAALSLGVALVTNLAVVVPVAAGGSAPDALGSWLTGVFATGCAVAFYIPLAINSWIDARRHVLLKNWTHLAAVAWLVALTVGDHRIAAIVSAIAIGAPFVAVSALSRGRLIGMGDARLLVVLAGWNGLWAPWGAVIMLVAGFGLHALAVLVLALRRRVRLRDRHPLGPALVLGSWLVWALMA